MNKWGWIIVIIIVLGGAWFLSSRSPVEAPAPTDEQPSEGSQTVLSDGTYTLDGAASSIGWTGSKTLIKDYYDSGTLSFTDGSVVVSNGAIATGTFAIDMKSFAVTATGKGSGNERLQGHLMSADFFDVEKFPTATVALKSVVDGSVTADVTIKGVTQEVMFPAAISQDGNTLTASAKFSIDRTEWDIRYGSTKFFGDLGDNVINDMVNVTLTLVATKQ